MICLILFSAALLFADDLKLIHRADSTTLARLQEDLSALHAWSIQNCLLFNLRKCPILALLPGRWKKSKNEVARFHLGGVQIAEKSYTKDVGLMINSNMQWTDHIDLQIGKSLKALFLLRRKTSSAMSIEGKVHLFRAIISPSLFLASECWDRERTGGYKLERFNKRVLKWICGYENYRKSILRTNLPPPLYFKVLKDQVLFSNIFNSQYNIDFSKHLKTSRSDRRRIVLPDIKYEYQRQNFWYRTGLRFNILQQQFNFFECKLVKPLLIKLM